jgi:hypothetical protein
LELYLELYLKYASTLAAANGVTSNAKATAIAEDAVIDFVFNATCLFRGKYKLCFDIKTQNYTKKFIRRYNKTMFENRS